jgi:hypothetical protein
MNTTTQNFVLIYFQKMMLLVWNKCYVTKNMTCDIYVPLALWWLYVKKHRNCLCELLHRDKTSKCLRLAHQFSIHIVTNATNLRGVGNISIIPKVMELRVGWNHGYLPIIKHTLIIAFVSLHKLIITKGNTKMLILLCLIYIIILHFFLVLCLFI